MGVTMMDDASFKDKLDELLQGDGAVPPPQHEKILHLARKSKDFNDQLQQKLNTLQNSLDYLRLSVKYLIFDLEATRRENVELRKRLNDAKPKPEAEF
jgi:hypothetical protein